MKRVRRVGVLTGGGDAPGLNAAIKSLVYFASNHDITVVAVHDGWRGLLKEGVGETRILDPHVVRTWDREGGTRIGSSRTNPFAAKVEGKTIDRSGEILANMERLRLDGLVAMGGEDTLGVARKLSRLGARIVGVPKTVDLDLPGTDYTLGFHTAMQYCTEAIERSRTPAGSHHWIQVVEVMGRHAGHLALWSGVAGGAFMTLIPEVRFDYRRVAQLLRARLVRGDKDRRYPRYAVVVVAEGAAAEGEGLVTAEDGQDAFGHVHLGGIGEVLSRRLRKDDGLESRTAVLGHPQRGGEPSPIDRIVGWLFGRAAVEALVDRKFGHMVSAKGVPPACSTRLVDLAILDRGIKTVDLARYYDRSFYRLK